ncbi:laminin subunit alpha-like [Tachypleus tridentatus]|uniref:laminin subunit alpha-like n=1 Tax=Tachypleus tridentatus TaxID=6853 RepID=UPI003FCF4DC8
MGITLTILKVRVSMNIFQREASRHFKDGNNLDYLEALYPQLEQAKDGVQMVAEQNGKTDRELDIIQKELDKLPYRSLEVIAQEAANNSLAAEAQAKGALDRVQDITEKLPEDEKRANQVPQDYEDAKHALEAAHNYVHRALAIVPNITVAMKKVEDKNKVVSRLGKDVADKIAELRRKVELARDQANRIKVGVKFYGNTTLQLRNPTDMNAAATYTYMSLYFRIEEKNGLLAYVGNEIELISI